MVNRRLFITGASASGFAASLAQAQPVPAAPAADPMQALAGMMQTGLYLPFLGACRAAASDPKASSAVLQQLSLAWALVGDETRAYDAYRRWARLYGGATPPDLTGARAEDAIEAIVRAARGRRVVILNEAHTFSRSRAFAEAVALRLRGEGFESFAAESFDDVGDLNRGGPVTADAGVYVRDPVYAELLRGARGAGFKFFAYEASDEPAKALDPNPRIAREMGEAANLAAGALAAGGKVLVYCGHGHVLKAESNGLLYMAGQLKARTGLDPLCIRQSDAMPDPSGHDAPFVAGVLDRFKPQRPIAVFDRQGAPVDASAEPGALDISVFHPRLAPVSGRPGWLAVAPGRRAAAWRMAPPLAGEALLQAVPQAEATAQNVIPADQFMLTPGRQTATFFLRPGRYEVRVETVVGRRRVGSLSV
jgi:hypothetical protein